MSMYTAPFTPKRSIDFFLRPGKKEKQEMVDTIRQDLLRFLPPAEISIFETGGFSVFFDALNAVFGNIRGINLIAPEKA